MRISDWSSDVCSSDLAWVALALGIPGEGVMGLVGPHFVAGIVILAVLLSVEVVAATAAVSDAGLVYVARHRNLMISLLMVGIQIALSFALIPAARAALLTSVPAAAIANTQQVLASAKLDGQRLAKQTDGGEQ